MNVYLKESRSRLLLVECAPVAAVAGRQSSSYEQDEIHKPPNSQTSESQKLPDGSARVAQTEAVHAEAAQEKGVEERGDEVVTRVSADTSDVRHAAFGHKPCADPGSSCFII
ncbi:hypothetical protein Baya_10900 [Bagarius yarrelli]|uniref:Uncharacterized protein n=1 Tax=Bagarius yarrelli TaxID=175774 RepID=A0A556V0T4_BAGYA|nr:hypothetical protein Baya_10900 [Bagarius yarrelli]